MSHLDGTARPHPKAAPDGAPGTREGLSPRRSAALHGLVLAGDRVVRGLDAELGRRHGIGLRAFEVLHFLAVFAPGGHARLADIVEHTPLSQSRVSRMVAELEGRGLLERAPADGDGRGVSVRVTPRGAEVFRRARETHQGWAEHRLFSSLSAKEIRQLGTITAKILDASGPTPAARGRRGGLEAAAP